MNREFGGIGHLLETVEAGGHKNDLSEIGMSECWLDPRQFNAFDTLLNAHIDASNYKEIEGMNASKRFLLLYLSSAPPTALFSV